MHVVFIERNKHHETGETNGVGLCALGSNVAVVCICLSACSPCGSCRSSLTLKQTVARFNLLLIVCLFTCHDGH